jgi:hypothetical protein
MGGWLVRQAEFTRVERRIITAPGVRNTDRDHLLDRWNHLKEILLIHEQCSEYDPDHPLTEAIEETLKQLIRDHIIVLKTAAPWLDVKLIALIVSTPRTHPVEYRLE